MSIVLVNLGAAPMSIVLVKCALVPATPCNQHHHSPCNSARRTSLTPSVLARRTPPLSRPMKPPRLLPPRTPVSQSCPPAGCQGATPPPDGHARRPETRQTPLARAAITCFSWARCRCRSHVACRCPMRPRTWHPVQSTPQPPQRRPSHPPHPVSPGPAHAASLPTSASSSSLPCPGCFRRVPLSLPHTRPRAARTFCRRCRPLRPARAACRRTTRPCRTHRETCACPCPAAAAASLATVRFMEFARGGAKGHSGSVGGGGTMHASTRPGSRWRTCRCVHGQSPVWDAALQRPVIAETARESGNCQGESACWSRCCGEK